MKNYLINEKELKELLTSHLTLMALDSGGVNNWEWYGDALNGFVEEWIENNNITFEDDEDDYYGIENMAKDYLNFYEEYKSEV